MLVYYTLFISAICFAPLLRIRITANNSMNGIQKVKKTTCKNGKVYILILFVFVALVIGLRDFSVGIDTNNYIKSFQSVVLDDTILKSLDAEYLSKVIIWMCAKIYSNSQVYLIVYSAITAYFFGRFIYKNSNDYMISTIIFLGMFFVQSMNLVRQWLALSIVINSIEYFDKREYKKGWFFLIAASLIHTTAIVAFVLPLIKKVKNKKRFISLIVILCFGVVAMKNVIFKLVISVIPQYYAYYANSYFLNEGGFNIKDMVFIAIIIGLLHVLWFRRGVITNDERDEFLAYITIMIFALTFSLSGETMYMLHRVVYYYSVFLIIIIPKMIDKMQLKSLWKFIIITAMFVMLYRNAVTDNNGISQYMWFWQ